MISLSDPRWAAAFQQAFSIFNYKQLEKETPVLADGRYVINEHGILKLIEVVNIDSTPHWRYIGQHHLRSYDKGLLEYAQRVDG